MLGLPPNNDEIKSEKSPFIVFFTYYNSIQICRLLNNSFLIRTNRFKGYKFLVSDE